MIAFEDEIFQVFRRVDESGEFSLAALLNNGKIIILQNPDQTKPIGWEIDRSYDLHINGKLIRANLDKQDSHWLYILSEDQAGVSLYVFHIDKLFHLTEITGLDHESRIISVFSPDQHSAFIV